jgi:glycosyltransferase involved in cell wall biosynthesis
MSGGDSPTSGVGGNDDPHVVHLITRLLRGGAEAKTLATVFGLDGYGFTVGHGASYDPDQVGRLHARGVDTRRFGLIRHYNPVAAVPAVFAVARYLHRADVDIVHTHSTEAGIIGRLAAHRADVPAVVHTVHGVPFSDDRSAALNRFVLACERRVAGLTDRIVTNADAIAAEYLDRGIGRPGQYTTVYSGIDVERFASADPATDLPGEGVRITMVGRLVEGKGLGVLLDAVDSLDRTDVTVCVVGDGPRRDAFETEVRERGLDDVVFTLGYRSDVDQILASSDVFVLPSFREGTPRVITEAMASGLPVVATDIAGVPEQVADGESGYLVETGDPGALADCLERLVDDPDLRERMGAAGRERVERFSTDRMLADLDAVYRDLLAE